MSEQSSIWRGGLVALAVLAGAPAHAQEETALAEVADEESFRVEITPPGGSVPARAPLRLVFDATAWGKDFRRIDVYANDLRVMRSEDPLVTLEQVMLPPGRHALRIEAVNQTFWRARRERSVTVEDPAFVVPGALSRLPDMTVDRWNAAFLSAAGLGDHPFETYDPQADGRSFAGTAGYWVRAHTAMARLTGSRYYLDKAGAIVHIMLESTDARRAERGELSPGKAGYDLAPGPILQDGAAPAPGWRYVVPEGEEDAGKTVVDVGTDGRILHHIMTYAHAVLSDPRFEAHRPFALGVVERAAEIAESHTPMWAVNRTPQMPGSFYQSDGAGGVLDVPVPLSDSAAMLSAQLLIHAHAPDTAIPVRAERLAAGFAQHMQRADGTVLWSGEPLQAGGEPPLQNIVDGMEDVAFLILADEAEVGGLDSGDMQALARTFVSRIAGGPSLGYLVNGAERRAVPRRQYAVVGTGWIGLAEYDTRVFETVLGVFRKREFLPETPLALAGWANIMQWYVNLH